MVAPRGSLGGRCENPTPSPGRSPSASSSSGWSPCGRWAIALPLSMVIGYDLVLQGVHDIATGRTGAREAVAQ